MTQNHRTPRVILAIDFGTACSGSAFAFPGQATGENEVHVLTHWPDQPFPYAKTLTTLLYNAKGELEAWGCSARKRLAELRAQSAEAAQKCRFLQGFKVQLRHGKRTAEGPVFKHEDQTYFVLHLVSDYLRCLKDYTLALLQGGVAGLYQPQDIRWCLTVPAMWTEEEKQFMRRAAVRAGLISPHPRDSARLCLVLEPEAAALYCQEHDRRGPEKVLHKGTRFMVVDAGGGTVDVTVHQVGDNHELSELLPAAGSLHGGKNIDKAFEEHLKFRLGPNPIEKLQARDPLAWVTLLDDWERAKCNYQPGDERTAIPLPAALHSILEKEHGPVLEHFGKLTSQGGDTTRFYVNQDEMRGLFEPTLNGIVATVQRQLDALQKSGSGQCDCLFLVGGFSSSPLLQQRIRTQFGDSLRVIVPPNPGYAVLSGAVTYGLNPEKIRARRSRLTYGCRMITAWSPNDPADKTFVQKETGKKRTTDRFSVFIRAGEIIDVDKVVKQSFQPLRSEQTRGIFAVYASPNVQPRFIDEKEVIRVGTLEVDMSDVDGGLDRSVDVLMHFGNTEITVAAKSSSGRPVKTKLTFDSTYFPEEVGR